MRPNAAAYRSVKDNSSLSTAAKADHNFRGNSRPSYAFFQQHSHQPPQSTLWTPSSNGCYNSNCHRQLKTVTSLQLPAPHPATFNHSITSAINHQQHNEKSLSKLSSFLPRTSMGINSTQRNYAKLPLNALNQQRVNECAGIPLISTASTHLSPNQRQRLQRKSSNSPTHNYYNPPPPPPPPPAIPTSVTAHYNWHKPQLPPQNTCDVSHSFASQATRNCISQLAAHAQGLPLLLNKQQNQHQNHYWGTVLPPNYNNVNLKCGNFNAVKKNSVSRNQRESEQNLKKENKIQTTLPRAICNSNSSNYTCARENFIIHRPTPLTDPATEHVDLSETCLPRIIKPRKRRKKDRKPVNGVYVKMNDEENATLSYKNAMAINDDRNFNEDNNMRLDHNYNSQSINHQQHNFQPIYYQTKLSNPLSKQQIVTNPQNTIQCQSFKNNNFDKHSAVCFCHQCDDPLRRIWDYPLRRSCSDSSATSADSEKSTSSSAGSLRSPTRSRAEIVGVIGSNRCNYDNNKHNNDSNLLTTFSYHINAGCQSDSNDSGYGDILSGINFADDLFNKVPPSSHSAALEPESLLLHPKTAESLLNESINEISRKLLETCNGGIGINNTGTALIDNDNKNNCIDLSNVPATPQPTATTLRLSSLSNASDLSSSDSGIGSASLNGDDLVFNFEQLHIEQLSTNILSSSPDSNNNTTNFNLHQSNLLFPPSNELLLEFELDLNNNRKGFIEQSQPITEHNQQFFTNCFDFVWRNSNAPSSSTSSSAATSFPLNPIRKAETSIFSA